MPNSLAQNQAAIKVLWVDDDELVLSSARRLLRNRNIELVTTTNPKEVLSLLSGGGFSIVVADQRMPQMTGVEVLEQVKTAFPQMTRIMLTGFLDSATIEDSINRAGVFRFITKPWNDEELIADIQQGYEHFKQLNEQHALTIQVREQNKKLTTLNENLEKIVFDRTKIISEAKREVENKNNKIKNLIAFIQELNRAEAFEELLIYFKKEFQSKFSVIVPYLFYESEKKQPVIMYFQKNEIIEKPVEFPAFIKLDIHQGKREEREYIAHIVGRPVNQLLCVPLLKFQSDGFVPILFLEHDLKNEEYELFLDFLTERLQVIGLAVDRSLMIRKLQYDSLRWEKTFDSIEDPIAIIDIDFNILRMNQAFDQFSKTLSSEEMSLIQASAKLRATQNGQVKKGNQVFETYTYPIMFSGSDRPTNFVNYYLDITRKRELYGKMIQNEKMVALGLMAGNIAHELNNPLTGIRSIAQVLVKEEADNQRLVDDLEEVAKASLRCQKIIEDLLDFSQTTKKIKDQDVVFSVNEVINKTLPLLKTAMRFHNLHLELSPKDPHVLMKPHQLQQVIFNLINNACQAMNDPGTITIKTETEKNFVLISISDTGVGIEASLKEKIFEPFFTTKLEGEGTGLGLSVCASIVEKAKGKITVESEVKKGSTFKVSLPKVELVARKK